jgi:outer membrane protein OmpA-like peptidoglycan-associated protein
MNSLSYYLKQLVFNVKSSMALFVCLSAFSLTFNELKAQSTETFETESNGTTSFTDNGQTFTFSGAGADSYDIEQFSGGGWNGSGADNKFIDNTGSISAYNDGTSLSISPSGGAKINVIDLYVFCSTNSLGNHSGTITFTGKNAGSTVYTFTKSSGFSNVSTFSPNNGFTYIDFASAGASDYSNVAIDELVISSTGNLDYIALDAFQWEIKSEIAETPAQKPVTTPAKPEKPVTVETPQIPKAAEPANLNLVVNFASGAIDPMSKEWIAAKEQLLGLDKGIRIRLEGHADNVGSEASNQKLALERAQKTKDMMVSLGFDPALITVNSAGETNPIASNDSEEGRAKNRRVEIKIQ